MTSPEKTASALTTARRLAARGIPIFIAHPALGADGQWDPKGGSGQSGYVLPAGWQATTPDPAVVDTWRPGDALAAVMGAPGPVDCLDVDPRNGGDATAHQWGGAGVWPTSYGRQLTPSGGWHDLIAATGCRSMDGVDQGLDLKAGAAGRGHGFIWIAPTVKLSKSTGNLAAYEWVNEPDLVALDGPDDSTGTLKARVDAKRAPQASIPSEGLAPAWSALSEAQRGRIEAYLAQVVADESARFAEIAIWSEGHRDQQGRGWEKCCADLANRLGRLTRASWTPWTEQDGAAAYDSVLPEQIRACTAVNKWRDQWHRRGPAPMPDSLAESLAELEAAEPTMGGGGAAKSDVARGAGRTVTLTPASAFTPRPVRWLWEGRLALATMGLLSGREGIGKSTLAYWLAARVTRGELPGDRLGQPGAVLVSAMEDSWEHTIVPRLIAANADLDKVFRIDVTNSNDDPVGLMLPRDNSELEKHALDVGAALLLFDPLTSRLGELDTHRDAEVRKGLEPIVRIADRCGFAILGLIHHNKSGSSDPLHLVTGSRAFTAVARSVHTCIVDPDDENRCLFGTPKNNLGRANLPTLAYTVASHRVDTSDGPIYTGRIEWGESISGQSISDCMKRANATDDERSAVSEAAGWVRDYLETNGGIARSIDVKNEGRKAGHSERTIQRARERLRLTSRSTGYPRVTYWELPAESSPEPPSHASVEPTSRGDGTTVCIGAQLPSSSTVVPVVPVAPTPGRKARPAPLCGSCGLALDDLSVSEGHATHPSCPSGGRGVVSV
ncbi:MAG: AAA family ATPase [Actinobacteria bacterium]|nr:AAA family ATPase [Actinomycetota bacterium]